jgi:hypothetical protein
VPTQPWQRPVTIWAYKPEAANTVWKLLIMSGVPLETCSAFKKNFGIINSITNLHLVGISTETFTFFRIQTPALIDEREHTKCGSLLYKSWVHLKAHSSFNVVKCMKGEHL